MHVRLRRDWPTSFSRSIREPVMNKDGSRRVGWRIVKTLAFQPGEMVEITDPAELDAIKRDLGRALEEMHPKARKEVSGPTEPPPAPESSTAPPEPVEVSAVADAFAGIDESPLDIEDKTHEHVSRHSRKR